MGEICTCVHGCVHKTMRANDFFILPIHFDLELWAAHSSTHSTSITRPCPDTHRAHKEPCPLQSGHCEARTCEICLWSCLGMRDYGGFRLQSPKLYVRTLTDGEIHGGLRPQWSFIIHQMRGPKNSRKDLGSKIQCFVKPAGIMWFARARHLKTHNLQEYGSKDIVWKGER